MAHAQVCPICGGDGMIPDVNYKYSTAVIEKVCNGCHGRGWIEVND